MLIRVVTLANLILNCTLIMPYILVLSFLNIKNWLYPAINCLDVFISIVIAIKLFTV